MDECNFSFKFPAVPRSNSVEWCHCRWNRQERRQTSMLFLGRASSTKQGSIVQKSWQLQIVLCVHHKWHTDTVCEMDLVKAQDMGLIFLNDHSVMLLFSSERSDMEDHRKSHRTYQQSKQISVHRVTDSLTKASNRKRLDFIRNCVNSSLQAPHRG